MVKKYCKRIVAITMCVCMVFSLTGCRVTDKISEWLNESAYSAISTTESTDYADYEFSTTEADNVSDEAIAEQEKFQKYLNELFVEEVSDNTLDLHYSLADPEAYGVTPPEEPTYGEIEETSDETIEEDRNECLEEIDELEAFNYDLLTSSQKYDYDVIHETLKTNLELIDYTYLYEPFAYTSGLHSNLPIVLSEYIFYDKSDVDDYLVLLKQTPEYVDMYLDFERTKSEMGLFMNANSASEVIRQCEEFIADPENNLLIETFNSNIEEVEGLSSSEIEEYKKENHDAVINYIIPAYENIISVFEELKNTGKNELGLCYLDGGKEYYTVLLKSKVGTDKTPEEVIETLDDKIAEVSSLYGTAAFSNYLAYSDYIENEDNIYEERDPKKCIRYFEKVFEERFPKAPDFDFTITPVHESLENIVSPAFYMTPPIDRYSDNVIHTNLNSDGAGTVWSTLAHEGFPGHMYQFVYYFSTNPEPIRTLINCDGYSEGWATYVEHMSFDYYDEYEHDCYKDFEKYTSETSLLVSARVEIGVNYEGWDLEDTREYLDSNGFNGDAAQDIMDYVIAEPVNYQMYTLGWLEFEELRSFAKGALGSDFDEQEFHKVLLEAGPSQFYLLKQRVENYIAETK